MAVHNKDEQMLDYLLNKFTLEGKVVSYPIWNTDALFFILRGTILEGWYKGIEIVLKGDCAEHLFLAKDYY